MRCSSIEHEFIEFIPSELKEGVLYVSVQYATAVHKCACGCGNKVVTPISPVDWQLLFDGDSVSLTPSIGNWEFPCRSHYWIRSNKIHWANAWTAKEVAAGKQREVRDYERYFAGKRSSNDSTGRTDTEMQAERQPRKGFLARVLHWLGR